MALKQDQAPIVEALAAYLKESMSSFGVPGHKGGKGAPADIYRLLTPSEAFFSPSASVPLKADGRVGPAKISQHPLGVPGEQITETHVTYFEIARAAGMFPMDANDRKLHEVRVVAGGKKR